MATQKTNRLFSSIVSIMPKLLVAVLVLPVLGGLVNVILPAFGWLPALDENSLSVKGFTALFATSGIGTMVLLSFSTALISTLLAFTITLLIIASYFNSPWLSRIQRLLGPILVIPHAAAAIAIAFLITPSGLFSRILSPWLSNWQTPPDWLLPHDPFGLSIILGLTLKELPFLLLMALAALSQAEIGNTLRAQYKVALSLGYCPMTAFFKVVLPPLYPYLRLPILAVLAYASASVEIPLILGPNTPPTLAVAILHWFHDVDLTLRVKASAGGLLQLVVTLLTLACWVLLEWLIKTFAQNSLTNGRREYAGQLLKWLTHLLTLILIGTILLALAGLILWSLAGFWRFPAGLPEQLILMHWQSALSHMHMPVINTLLVGFAATSMAILLAIFTLEAEQQRGYELSKLTSLLIYLPMLIPSIAFLFGLVWLQEQLGSQHPYFNVIFSHLLFVLPYVFLSLASSYRLLDKRFAQVGASLGASPFKVFIKIKLPQLLPAILVALALGLAISFSQYLATILPGGGRINTVTTEAVALANGASRRVSSVYALMQMILPALGFILAWLLPKFIFRHKDY